MFVVETALLNSLILGLPNHRDTVSEPNLHYIFLTLKGIHLPGSNHLPTPTPTNDAGIMEGLAPCEGRTGKLLGGGLWQGPPPRSSPEALARGLRYLSLM